MPKHYLNPFRKGVHHGGTPYSSAIRTPPSASRCREDKFCPFNPTPGQIQAFHEQYEAALAAGQIVTYSLEKKCLVEWFSLEGLSLTTTKVLWDNYLLRDSIAHRFLKNSPVIVPPVASAKVLLTEQELTDYVNSEEYMDGDVIDSGDEGFSVKYNTSGSSVFLFYFTSYMDWSPQTTSSASSIGQVSSYLTHLSPSSSLDSISSTPTGSVNSSPTQPRRSPRKSDGRAVAYFSALVAETRGSPNHTFVLNIYNNHEAGLYKTHPEQHPVHQSPLADMLLPYHPAHCDLVHSFEADKAHRNEGGECQDIGQGQTSSILKGKGREMVLY
ncbi:hypothetical protein B0H10DRAFT_1969935 [Mycena sp. CBHHK59/15]|nr:hypothetical protein B0H10DRAFT_1969935 [Mycena sp. CBHHK59/15]